MPGRTFWFLVFLLHLDTSAAQAVDDLDGEWAIHGRFAGAERVIDVVIEGTGGTYGKRFWANIKFDSCNNREMPIKVLERSADDLVFRIERSAVIAGCADSTFTLHRQPDGTFAGYGRFDNDSRALGLPVRLQRP